MFTCNRRNSNEKKDFWSETEYVSLRIRKIIYIATALIIIGAAVFIFIKLKRMERNGWSLKKEAKEITINAPEYTLALTYWEDMDYPRAEALLKNILNKVNQKSGSASLESAAISQKLGALYLEEGKYEDAYEFLNDAYVTFNKKLGQTDGNTIIAQAQIALYDFKKGNIESAFATYNKLYDTTKYIPYKIQICQMLAQCYTDLGRYQAAFNMYDILGEYYSQFEIFNSDRVKLLNGYGVLMITVCEYSEAIKCLNGAVDTWKSLQLEDESLLATLYTNLAKAYMFLGNHQDALTYQAKAIETLERIYGNMNIHVAIAYDALSENFCMNNDTQMRKEYLDKALSIALSTVGENHAATAQIYDNLGQYYRDTHDYPSAINCHDKALEVRKNILGINNVNTINIYAALAEDYRLSGRPEAGLTNITTAIGISEKLYGRENLYSAVNYIIAALLYSDLNEYENASQYAQMALDICNRQPDNSGAIRAYAHQAYGYVCKKHDDNINAVKYLAKAADLYQNELTDNTKNILETLLLLANSHLALGNKDLCASTLLDAQAIIDAPTTVSETSLFQLEISSLFNDLYSQSGSNLDFDSWFISLTKDKNPS